MRITFKKVVKTLISLSGFLLLVVLFYWDKSSSLESLQSLQDGHGGEQEPLVESFGSDIVRPESKVFRSQRSAKSFSPEIDLHVHKEKKKKTKLSPKSLENSDIKATDINDVFISVKTTSSFHETRMKLLLETWISTCRKQTYIFTDRDDLSLSEKMPDGHVINTNCPESHYRKSLCCKMAKEFDFFIDSNKRWFCHVDDDNYLNTDQLVKLLQKYNHSDKWYLGKPSLSHPLEIQSRTNEGQKVAFWFATGGAGFCISRALGIAMVPEAGGGKLTKVGDSIRLPDDCTVGYIINHLLKVELTRVELFHSHLESQSRIKDPKKHITMSYHDQNVASVPGFSLKEDPTRFKSIHCTLNPRDEMCESFPTESCISDESVTSSLSKMKCKIHPDQDSGVLCCQQCEEPVCMRCISTEKHHGHSFVAASEMVVSMKDKCCEQISKIKETVIPNCRLVIEELGKNLDTSKHMLSQIRSTMTSRIRQLKDLLDEFSSKNMKDLTDIEQILINEYKAEEHKMAEHIALLQAVVEEYEKKGKKMESGDLMSIYNRIQKLKEIPSLKLHHDLPSFEEGELNTETLEALFGKLFIPASLQGPMQNIHPKKLKLAKKIQKVKAIHVPDIDRCRHISCMKSNKCWVGDELGNLVEIDPKGNEIQKIKTHHYKQQPTGFHAVTKDDELLFIDQYDDSISKLIPGKKKKVLVTFKGWTPISIHVSHVTSDLLVGMMDDSMEKAKVVRYCESGKELKQYEFDENSKKRLYSCPHYIAENINGDIVASDWEKQVVVAVGLTGNHRFDYDAEGGHPPGTIFEPSGICTDVLGNILVCDNNDHMDDSVHMLDKDGRFLCLILRLPASTLERRIRAIGMDNKYNLWVGDIDTNEIRVYKYIE
ncbi:uncharacterized protein LOC133190710 [Saccostrea echinata]|uniref:uncharacterized protein LOC133190710 n=1 Tax=Saccostrea echinata TaxID=191078 RepID=UPI002A80ECB3|nr:uncharacterized protein LOC133190710 [Saccostrea echinata]